LQNELESVRQEMNEMKMARGDQPLDHKIENQTQFDNLQGNHPLMQSQADWQVVDSKKIHKEKSKKKAAAKGGNSDVMD
jgi:hypothetical protein